MGQQELQPRQPGLQIGVRLERELPSRLLNNTGDFGWGPDPPDRSQPLGRGGGRVKGRKSDDFFPAASRIPGAVQEGRAPAQGKEEGLGEVNVQLRRDVSEFCGPIRGFLPSPRGGGRGGGNTILPTPTAGHTSYLPPGTHTAQTRFWPGVPEVLPS